MYQEGVCPSVLSAKREEGPTLDLLIYKPVVDTEVQCIARCGVSVKNGKAVRHLTGLPLYVKGSFDLNTLIIILYILYNH